MSRSTPRIKLSCDGLDVVVTISQETQSGEITEVIMKGSQFSCTMYILKSVETQLIADQQQTYDQNSEREVRPKSPTPPSSFEELFENINQPISTECDGETEAVTDEQTFEMSIVSENGDEDDEYDPVNLEIDQRDEIECYSFDKKLYKTIIL